MNKFCNNLIKENFNKFSILIIAILVCIDLITKSFFMNKSFFEGFFIHISYVINSGSAFGIFSNTQYYNLLIIVLSAIVLAVIFYKRGYFKKNCMLFLVYIFLISGLIGNLFDRIFFGFVRDFIVIEGFFVFNIADFYLTIAAVLIILNEIISHQ